MLTNAVFVVALLSVIASKASATDRGLLQDERNDWIFDRFFDDWSANTQNEANQEQQGQHGRLTDNHFGDRYHQDTPNSVVLVQNDQEQLKQNIKHMLLHRNHAHLRHSQQQVLADDVSVRKRSKEGAWVWVPAQGMIYVSGEVQDEGTKSNKVARYGR